MTNLSHYISFYFSNNGVKMKKYAMALVGTEKCVSYKNAKKIAKWCESKSDIRETTWEFEKIINDEYFFKLEKIEYK